MYLRTAKLQLASRGILPPNAGIGQDRNNIAKMLAISFVGKKFSCNAQFEVAAEKDGGGLKLALRISERCSQHLKPPGPVLATLHVSINNGRPNNIAKCKELLNFLKEQVLPKTLKFIGVQGIKTDKDKSDGEGVSLLSCIWPGKSKKRVEENQGKATTEHSARGYSSDNESYTQKPLGKPSLSDSDMRHPPKTSIFASPRLVRAQLMRKTSFTVQEDGDNPRKTATKSKAENMLTKSSQNSLERRGKSDAKDVTRRFSQSSLRYNTRAKSDLEVRSKAGALRRTVSEVYKEVRSLDLVKNQEKSRQGKVKDKKNEKRSTEIGPQDVQKHQSDSDASTCYSPDGLRRRNVPEGRVKISPIKDHNKNGLHTSEDKTSAQDQNVLDIGCEADFSQRRTKDLEAQDTVCDKTNKRVTVPSGNQASSESLEMFAAEFVRDICRSALEQTRCCMERANFEDSTNDLLLKATPVNLVTRKVIDNECNVSEQESIIRNNEGVLMERTDASEGEICHMTTTESSEGKTDTEVVITGQITNENEGENSAIVSSLVERTEITQASTDPYSLSLNKDPLTDRNITQDGVKMRDRVHAEIDKDPGVATGETRPRDMLISNRHSTMLTQSDFLADSKELSELQIGYSMCMDEDGPQYLHLDAELCTVDVPRERRRNISCLNCSSLDTVAPMLEIGLQASNYETEDLYQCINCGQPNSKQDTSEQDMSLDSAAIARKRWSIHDVTSNNISIYDASENVREKLNFPGICSACCNCYCACSTSQETLSTTASTHGAPSQSSQSTPGFFSSSLWDTSRNVRSCQGLATSAHFSPNGSLPRIWLSPPVDTTENLWPLVSEKWSIAHETCTSKEPHAANEIQSAGGDVRGDVGGENTLITHSTSASNSIENVMETEDGKESELDRELGDDSKIISTVAETVSISVESPTEIEEKDPPDKSVENLRVNLGAEEKPPKLPCNAANGVRNQHEECVVIEKPTLRKSTQFSKKQENYSKARAGFRRNILYRRTVSETLGAERKRWSSSEPCEEKCNRPVSTPLQVKTTTKSIRLSPRSVLSEDDVVIEGLVNHHQDIYDSLAKRTWIILHVHGLWNAGRPMDAVKTCIELTGMSDIEEDLDTTPRLYTPYSLLARDYALFLNILLQLPISCSMWTLDLCVLVLPKLKGFISIRHHTSHVEMACNVLHVVLKKVTGVVRRGSKGPKNKEKAQMIRDCTAELKEIKDRTSNVIHGVKPGGRNITEDASSMKLMLKELQIALGTFLSNAGTN